MKRLLPSSLLAQVMVSVALALFLALTASAFLIFQAIEERREAAVITTAAYEIVRGSERRERRTDRGPQRRGPRRDPPIEIGPPGLEDSRIRGLPRPLRYLTSNEAPFASSSGDEAKDREEQLLEVLAQEGINPSGVAVMLWRAEEDPEVLAFARENPRFENREGWRKRQLFIATIQRQPSGPWETARVLVPPRPPGALGVLLLQTLITFVLLMLVLFFVLRRITRPLAQLTERVDTFSRQPERAVLLEETGPSDTRRLIAAHNVMEMRIAALLDEKDVMLGAIGHDLKTPLAALRVRIESVPDDTQRAKMADSIEDITATLDDILSLARVGRDGSSAEAVDLGALASGIAEEFEDMGEPVTIHEPQRLVAHIQVTWIKRALRNLVSNAVRYGKSAEVSVLRKDERAILRVDDNGPGINPDDIDDMLGAFTRGEASRNRETGGAGLGLTLARAIAEQHQGKLVLENREEGGLRAEIRIPLAP